MQGATSGQVQVTTRDANGADVTPGYLDCTPPTGATPINDANGTQVIADNEGVLFRATLFDSETIIYPAYTAPAQ